MTVKSLNETSKKSIVTSFTTNTATINDLARFYGKHRRTIIRVLEEQGVNPKIKPRAKRIQPSIPSIVDVDLPDHSVILNLHQSTLVKAPWYQRMLSVISFPSRYIR